MPGVVGLIGTAHDVNPKTHLRVASCFLSFAELLINSTYLFEALRQAQGERNLVISAGLSLPTPNPEEP